MNPSLLPYVAAAAAIVVFLVIRQALRKMLELPAANLVGAMLAGLVYYVAFLYKDEILDAIHVPEGALPVALLVTLALLAVATLSRRRPLSPVQRPPVGPSPTLRHPPAAMYDEAPRSPGRLGRGRPYRQFRPASRYDRYDDGRYPRRPAPRYSDDRYPDDDEFAER
jgi:hypothetical protein